jgi:hypothetical protein
MSEIRVTILPPGELMAWKRRDQARDRRLLAEGRSSPVDWLLVNPQKHPVRQLRDPTADGNGEDDADEY